MRSTFNTEEDFNLFTIVDANNDGSTWEYNATNGVAYCTFSSMQASDDWLITPEIHLTPGRKYNFSFSARRGMTSYLQQIGASFGEGLDPSTYTEIVPRTNLPENEWVNSLRRPYLPLTVSITSVSRPEPCGRLPHLRGQHPRHRGPAAQLS